MFRRSLLILSAISVFAGCFGKTLEKDGGVVLIYELAETAQVPAATVVAAIRQRLGHLASRGQLQVKDLGKGRFEVTLIGASEEEIDTAKKALRVNGDLEFRIVALRGKDDKLISAAADGKPPADTTQPFGKWVSYDPERCPAPEKSVTRLQDGQHEILVIDDELDVSGEMLEYARPWLAEEGWQLSGKMKPEGAALLKQLSRRNLPKGDDQRQLGIVLDGELLTAPTITSEIPDQFIISGQFSEADVRFIAQVLKLGTLPADLKSEPTSERRVPAKQ
jgi:preprotein translocase subunit SecD